MENIDSVAENKESKVINKHIHGQMLWRMRTDNLQSFMALVVAGASNIVILLGLAAVGLFAVWGISFALKMFLLTIGVL